MVEIVYAALDITFFGNNWVFYSFRVFPYGFWVKFPSMAVTHFYVSTFSKISPFLRNYFFTQKTLQAESNLCRELKLQYRIEEGKKEKSARATVKIFF